MPSISGEPRAQYKLLNFLDDAGGMVEIEISDRELSEALRESTTAKQHIESRYKAALQLPPRSIERRASWTAIKAELVDQLKKIRHIDDVRVLHAQVRAANEAAGRIRTTDE